MSIKHHGLGKGLDALLGDLSPIVAKKSQNPQILPIEFLQVGKYQPRKDMNPETLKELADSIKAQGIIQPIIVRLIADNKYEIIAGERRWRAAQLAKLQEVPVVIKQINDRSVMAMSLIENIQREDLNALEEAEALKRLLDEFKMTHQQIAEGVGKSRTSVSNLLRLLDLTDEVKNMLVKGLLEMGHARALLSLPHDKQIALAYQVVKQGLTVRAVERLSKKQGDNKKPIAPLLDTDTLKLQEELSARVGSKVIINHRNNGSGKMVLSYSSLEELAGIMQRIK